MDVGDVPPPNLEEAEVWWRLLCNRLRRLLPNKVGGTAGRGNAGQSTKDGGAGSSQSRPRQNVYNFNGTFYASITIYEEGDNEPTVEIRPPDAKATSEEDSDE